GDSRLMKQLAEKYRFTFLEAPSYELEGQVVSSSLIRSLVREGKLKEAGAFLGRPYSFFGVVHPGSGRGKTVGFPTANLDSASEVMPPEGVYAVWARIMDCELIPGAGGKMRLEDRTQNRRWEAVLNYGKRPTFGEETKPVAEVHVLDFEGDLTQKTVEVTIGKHLRPEMTFANQDLLCEQIERDIEVARKFFLTQN
ncbi:MAG: hypothetical protein HY588_02380, partial [Candidatus Omnitrophica bacterium]|nr:hypothetical protein [Candidatus Omnitrophota bacterium]